MYDHLFRRARDGSSRPALEGMTLLGAVAAQTARVTVGTLVARATLRPAAQLAAALDTAQRVSGGRLVAAIGAGDAESREEMETFGLPFGTEEERLGRLRAAVVCARDRGFPVWVGGASRATRALAAAEADGWNRWGGDAARFAAQARALAPVRRPFTVSWGGLVALGATDDVAREKAERLGAGPEVIVGGPERVAAVLRAYGDAGAEWVIGGPLDSSDPENAALLGAVRGHLGP